MKYLLIGIAALMFGSFIFVVYPERCVLPISLSLRANMDIDQLKIRINKYHADFGKFPKNINELVPEYIQRIPLDPWGRGYKYQNVINDFKLYSLGADGEAGGDGINTDQYGGKSVRQIMDEIKMPIWGCRA